jgi:hypothetical protein
MNKKFELYSKLNSSSSDSEFPFEPHSIWSIGEQAILEMQIYMMLDDKSHLKQYTGVGVVRLAAQILGIRSFFSGKEIAQIFKDFKDIIYIHDSLTEFDRQYESFCKWQIDSMNNESFEEIREVYLRSNLANIMNSNFAKFCFSTGRKVLQENEAVNMNIAHVLSGNSIVEELRIIENLPAHMDILEKVLENMVRMIKNRLLTPRTITKILDPLIKYLDRGENQLQDSIGKLRKNSLPMKFKMNGYSTISIEEVEKIIKFLLSQIHDENSILVKCLKKYEDSSSEEDIESTHEVAEYTANFSDYKNKNFKRPKIAGMGPNEQEIFLQGPSSKKHSKKRESKQRIKIHNSKKNDHDGKETGTQQVDFPELLSHDSSNFHQRKSLIDVGLSKWYTMLRWLGKLLKSLW